MPTIARRAAGSPLTDKENPGGFVHVPALDGIRGLAILLVLVDHLFWANDKTGSAFFDALTAICGSTYVGVNLFFALSGFLITGILLDTLTVPHFFRTFYARRSLRIFPLYYGFLLLILALTPSMHFIWGGWAPYYFTYSSNIIGPGTYLFLGPFNINHFWSLQVEEQFYLVWPLIVYLVRRVDSIVRISLIGCAVVLCIRIFLIVMRDTPAFANPYLPYSPTYSCADNILFGCGLCALLRTRWRQTAFDLAPRIFAVCAAIVVGFGIANGGLNWDNLAHPLMRALIPTLGFTLVGVACAAVIAMTLRPGSATQRFFSNRILRFFGKFSYGIYVFHFTLMGLFDLPLRRFFNDHLHSKALSVLLEALTIGSLSVLVAIASYYLYEVQFLKLKRFFSYNRSSTAAAEPSASEQPSPSR